MPVGTPFHSETSKRCISLFYKEWAGYHAVNSYLTSLDSEYFAIRHAVAAIDVSPLYKYRIYGEEACEYLSYVTSKDMAKVRDGRSTYLCWCDDQGYLIDDGTISFLDGEYIVTAAEPMYSWFNRLAQRYPTVKVEDISSDFGALSIQGPYSRDYLAQFDAKVADLKFFGNLNTSIDNIPVRISRTGYTGDLGYELWVASADAAKVYQALFSAGHSYGLLPCGLDAMDVARIEAGFIMNGVDYFSAHHCLVDHRKNNPYEVGLGWTIQLDRKPFLGQAALAKIKQQGPEKMTVGLDIDWEEVEKAFNKFDLPPEVCPHPWRDGRPVYDQSEEWLGQATSGAWSPILKKYLALAQLPTAFCRPGQEVRFEMTVEYRRVTVPAIVCELPFYNPARKRGAVYEPDHSNS